MHKYRSEKGFLLSGILLAGGALLVIFIIAAIALKDRLPNRSLVWRSDLQNNCDPNYESEKNAECSHTFQIYDAKDKLIAPSLGSIHNYVYALSKDTGKILWQSPIDPPKDNKLILNYFNGKIYVFEEGKLIVLNSITGGKLNELVLPFEINSNPKLNGQKFIVYDKKNNLYEIDTASLTINPIILPFWKNSSKIMSLDNNIIYYTILDYYDINGESVGKNIAFDYANKKLLWESDKTTNIRYWDLIDDKNIYIYKINKETPNLKAVNKITGEDIWSLDSDIYPISSIPMVFYKNYIVVPFAKKILIVNKNSGRVINTFSNKGSGKINNLKIEDDVLYTTYFQSPDELIDRESYILAVDINSGKKLTEFRDGKDGLSTSDPIIGDKYVFVICKDDICAFKKPFTGKN